MESIIKLRKSFETKEKLNNVFENLVEKINGQYKIEIQQCNKFFKYVNFDYREGKDKDSISGIIYWNWGNKIREIQIRVDVGEISEIQTLKELNILTEIILKCLGE